MILAERGTFRPMASTDLRVAVVGGGIGGLSLGLALRERGISANVFEQASELTEIGAAIVLSANGLREFARLGLLDGLAASSTIPTELIYRHWRTGERIAAHSVRKHNAYVDRFGAPYFGIHRADLQKTLSVAFGVENLHLGCRLVNIVEQADSVVLEFANGRVEHADLVVGADGVRSTVRRWVTGTDDAVYSGTSAFRGIVPVENLPSLPDPHAIQFWMGPDAHLLHYAIGGHGELVNFFAVVETPSMWLHDSTVVDVHEEVPVASFRGWHPAVTEMIRAAASPIRWGLFAVRPLLRWYRGRVVVLGDSAHGMLPHHGQGANTSIEDAFALAALLAGAGPGDLGPALARYEVLRRARTRKIQRSSWVTSALLHLPDGPAAERRNEKVGRVWLDFAWIHGYDVQQALREGTAPPAPAPPGRVATRGSPMSEHEILAGLAEVLRAAAGVDPARVALEVMFADDLGIDSLTMVDVVVAAEDRFGMLIRDDEWTRFRTVGDAVGYLARNSALAQA
jgi:salicylate hydroxylase